MNFETKILVQLPAWFTIQTLLYIVKTNCLFASIPDEERRFANCSIANDEALDVLVHDSYLCSFILVKSLQAGTRDPSKGFMCFQELNKVMV